MNKKANSSTLFNLLLELAKKQNTRPIDEEFEERLYSMIESNDLHDDKNVPTWVFDFFDAVLKGETRDRIRMNYSENIENVSNFMAEIEDHLEITYENEGEWYALYFDKIGMNAAVSSQSDFYSVTYRND